MFNIGDRVRILGGKGNDKIKNRVGYITLEIATKGNLNIKDGFNVDLGNLGVWRVKNDGDYEIISSVSVKRKFTPWKDVVIHFYERQPSKDTTIVKDDCGDVLSIQTNTDNGYNYKVIYQKDKGLTTVILKDGSKGVAKCMEGDIFNIQIGHDIAYKRARIAKLQKDIESLSK